MRNTPLSGGSVLVRRRIQTPSVAKVRSAVQLEEEVVLGASPPARRPLWGAALTRRLATRRSVHTLESPGAGYGYLSLASSASSASFVTVFQLRVVPATPSCFSKYALLSLDLP